MSIWDNIIYSSDPDLDLELNEKIEKLCLKNLERKLSPSEQTIYQVSLSSALTNIGIYHEQKGDYTPALDAHLRSLSIAKKIENEVAIGRALNNIGTSINAKEN